MQKTWAVKKQTMLKQTDWITTNGEKQCKNKHLENEKKNEQIQINMKNIMCKVKISTK